MSELTGINKVLIIDDRIEEALPIMKALYSKGIYSLYWDGQLESMPKSQFDRVRLVILDMRITDVTDSHTINRILFQLLSSVINENNGPYILCTWSKHNSEYFNSFKEELYENPKVPQPYLITSLEKKDFISMVEGNDEITREIATTFTGETSETGVKILEKFYFIPREEVNIQLLLEELETKLNEMNALSSLILWEQRASNAASDLISNIAMLSEVGESWNKNIENIIKRLANANAGKGLDDSATLKEYLANAFASLNQMLPDELWNQTQDLTVIDTASYSIRDSNITYHDQDHKYSISKAKKYSVSKDNIHLVTFSDLGDAVVQQNEHKEQIGKVFYLYLNSLGKTNFKLLCQRPSNINNKKPGKLFIASEPSISNEILNHSLGNLEIDRSQIQPVMLDISSSCDYAQQKLKRIRVLYGIQFPIEYSQKIKKNNNSDAIYFTPELTIDKQLVVFMFNFHFISNISTVGVPDAHIVEFREAFLNDIKHYLSTFISRVGILKIE